MITSPSPHLAWNDSFSQYSWTLPEREHWDHGIRSICLDNSWCVFPIFDLISPSFDVGSRGDTKEWMHASCACRRVPQNDNSSLEIDPGCTRHFRPNRCWPKELFNLGQISIATPPYMTRMQRSREISRAVTHPSLFLYWYYRSLIMRHLFRIRAKGLIARDEKESAQIKDCKGPLSTLRIWTIDMFPHLISSAAAWVDLWETGFEMPFLVNAKNCPSEQQKH